MTSITQTPYPSMHDLVQRPWQSVAKNSLTRLCGRKEKKEYESENRKAYICFMIERNLREKDWEDSLAL